jgi:hypothetical protein
MRPGPARARSGRVTAILASLGKLHRTAPAWQERHGAGSGPASGQQGIVLAGYTVTVGISAAEGHHGNVGYAGRAVYPEVRDRGRIVAVAAASSSLLIHTKNGISSPARWRGALPPRTPGGAAPRPFSGRVEGSPRPPCATFPFDQKQDHREKRYLESR